LKPRTEPIAALGVLRLLYRNHLIDVRSSVKKLVTFRLDHDLLERARRCASADNRTLTNYVETAILRFVAQSPDVPAGATPKNFEGPSRMEDIDS
jgi:hypothetical protein